MTKTLVVYYSLGGTTRAVARHLAKALGADFDEIEDIRPRRFWATLRGVLESWARGLPAIRYGRDPSEYELVVLASPVWAMSMSSPMRAYLHEQRGQLPRVACLCTWGGAGGADRALAEMTALAGDPQAPAASVHQRDVMRGRHVGKLRPFVERVRSGASKPTEAAPRPAPRGRPQPAM